MANRQVTDKLEYFKNEIEKLKNSKKVVLTSDDEDDHYSVVMESSDDEQEVDQNKASKNTIKRALVSEDRKG